MNQKYLSISLTLAIIMVLVISGPASAITLNIANVDPAINEADTLSFEVRADIEAAEAMGFSNFTVTLTDTNTDEEYACTFDVDGSPITPCEDFTITALQTPAEGVMTDLYGYGFGLSGWGPNEFGYGYGFLDTLAVDGEFIFQVDWDSPLVNGDTEFDIDFLATSRNGANLFIFQNEDAASLMVNDVPVIIVPDAQDAFEVSQNNTKYVFPVDDLVKILITEDIEGVSLDLATNYNIAGNVSEVLMPDAFGIYANTSLIDLIVEFPAALTIRGSGWDGVMRMPQFAVPSVDADDIASTGYTATIRTTIEIGFPEVELVFDKAVRLLIRGEGGRYVGYARDGDFTRIALRCGEDSQAWADANLADAGDCQRTVGDDLVIWTKHFTEFITYSQSSNAGGGGSSGGSSGGAISVTCVEEWVCSDWTACSPQGIRTRICTDNKACGTVKSKPAIQESCTYVEPQDTSSGTTIEKPVETQDKPPVDVTGDVVKDIQDTETKEGSGFASKLLYAIIIVLILGGVIGGYYINNDPDMLHRRSASLQRKADMAHMAGKVVEAQVLYEKAYKLQQKALNKKLK